jgi:hypothetical protein
MDPARSHRTLAVEDDPRWLKISTSSLEGVAIQRRDRERV